MRFLVLLSGLVGSLGFTFCPNFLPLASYKTTCASGYPVALPLIYAGVRHQSFAPLRVSMVDSITKVRPGDGLMGDVEKRLSNCQFWSCPPSMATMYTDNPEYFQIMQGKVEITPVTIEGKPLGESVSFDEEEFGIVPKGAFRWEIIKPTTKQTSCREGFQLLTKGWREEPPLKAMRGKGTLGTIGRTSEDDVAYLRQLIAEKGNIPKSAWENAISSKMDRDTNLSNVSFSITDRGVLVMDRVSDKILEVFDETGFVGYDPMLDYVETEEMVLDRMEKIFLNRT